MSTAEPQSFTLSFEPDFIRDLSDVTAFTLNGVRFQPGDAVWLTHRETGSRVYGRLTTFYGVGRIRGIHVQTPMAGVIPFPFLKPADHERLSIEHVNFGYEAKQRIEKIRGGKVIHLTPKEHGALSEAVRYSQQAHAENADDRLDPTLSRIQRKLGEEPSA